MSIHQNGDVIAGRYQVCQHLGTGGLGEVFLCLDTYDKKQVALKRLRADLAFPDYVIEQTEREARLLASLMHRNIIRVTDFGVDVQGTYFTLEYIEGPTLSLILHDGKVPLETFYQLTLQVLEGLAAAHRKQVLHLDIKPANLMLQGYPDPAFTVKILDFGLARLGDEISGHREDELTIGSVYYIAPEQLLHQPLDARTDLYSLGQVCYHMLAGTVTYPDPDPVVVRNGHLTTDPIRVERYNPQVSRPLADWIHSLISRDPEGRPRDAQDAITRFMRTVMANPLNSRSDNSLDRYKERPPTAQLPVGSGLKDDGGGWEWLRSQSGRIFKGTMDKLGNRGIDG
ncbi:MAG: serine/threonine-protein kinase [Candidatus Methylacidiphilales bacterium]|nr:serine/threonine-protein kinase [Candidatus Methylacidiphilales bacterium]